MKIKIMVKIKETDPKKAREYITHAMNKMMQSYEFQFQEANKLQSWGFPKEFKK